MQVLRDQVLLGRDEPSHGFGLQPHRPQRHAGTRTLHRTSNIPGQVETGDFKTALRTLSSCHV